MLPSMARDDESDMSASQLINTYNLPDFSALPRLHPDPLHPRYRHQFIADDQHDPTSAAKADGTD